MNNEYFCRMTSDVISKSRFSMRFSKARRSFFASVLVGRLDDKFRIELFALLVEDVVAESVFFEVVHDDGFNVLMF